MSDSAIHSTFESRGSDRGRPTDATPYFVQREESGHGSRTHVGDEARGNFLQPPRRTANTKAIPSIRAPSGRRFGDVHEAANQTPSVSSPQILIRHVPLDVLRSRASTASERPE